MDSEVLFLFLQQGIASGIVSGSVYALLALAIVMIFKTSEVPNFAQGEVFMVAAYAALFLIVFYGLPMWVVIPAALLFTVAGMMLFEAGILRRVKKALGEPVNLVIATLGLSFLLRGLVRQTGLGDTPRSFPSLVSTDPVQIGQAMLTRLDLAIVGTAVAVMAAVFLLFNFTRAGRAMRALGMNPKAAALVGIDIRRTHAFVWGLSGLVSAISALLIAPKILMTPEMGHVAILAFAAAIVGGFNSLPGAVLGGFIIGIAENLVGLFVSASAIVVTPFLAIMAVLVLRPQGLLGGRPQMRKV
ncbi:branched-chain amino acid transport system permease protein [Roseomonas rosea]|uniref:Branched-chain amino acid transport system permease protein n=1 Tax=Muricoccus roseus TaxID=198092 RepID=A0A1M6LSD6_9PROT|nr:branched-chain amino acid ABC transporter permease [Roseomonas rosea]SHJ74168.1 branched-chain amino acid transport system permease protein [Roseomonas rosea]